MNLKQMNGGLNESYNCMNTKTIHCCNLMDASLANRNIGIRYLDFFREYGILKLEDDNEHEIIPIKPIQYCPWCSIELPKNCHNLWYETLKKEYNINDPWNENFQVPIELQSDEWWIKRGY
jgi:hypothetical protein